METYFIIMRLSFTLNSICSQHVIFKLLEQGYTKNN